MYIDAELVASTLDLPEAIAWMREDELADGEIDREYNGINSFPFGGKGEPLFTAAQMRKFATEAIENVLAGQAWAVVP